MWHEHFSLYALLYAGLEVLGFCAAIIAIMRTRTPQGAVAWVMSLLFMPLLALPLYLIFGRKRFNGYMEEQRSKTEEHPEIQKITLDLEQKFAPFQSSTPSPERAPLQKCLSELVRLPLTSGNDATLLINGKETFREIFNCIEKAEHFILAEFFIIKDDSLGDEFQHLLIKKARQGVKVYLIFDELGSHKLKHSYLAAFQQEPHIFISPFGGKRHFFSNIVRLNFRNHRKIVIADGQIALLGGLNVGNEYLGKGELGHWRDTFVKLTGPCVQAVQLAFLEDWHWATKEILDLPTPLQAQAADKDILIVPSGPADFMETWRQTVIALAHAAQKRLWIASPYFVPGEGILSALQSAALRGVDVRILLPDKADHLLVYGSSFTFYPQTLPYNVRLFRYKKGFLHEKVILVDDDISTIGTANLDNRSMRLNFEINALIYNKQTAAQVEHMFEQDFKKSRPVALEEYTQRSWFFRLGCSAARLLAPIQ